MAKGTVHEEVGELLPWFVNDSLGEKEQQKVLTHLRECESCRLERDQLQQLQLVVADDVDAEGANYRFAFRKLMHRIDVAEANRASTIGFGRTSRLERNAPWLGVAASLLIALVFMVALNEPNDGPEGADFRTLSDPAVRSEGVPSRLALTFEQPIRAETLRAALIETHSNIVSGPDSDGSYVVEVSVPTEMTDDQFIRSIRDIEGVKYAAFEQPSP